MLLCLAIVWSIAVYALLGAVLFLAAGTVAVPMFWAYLIALSALSVLTIAVLYARDPDLLRERMKPGAGEQDRLFKTGAMIAYLAHCAIAGADVGRWHLTATIPLAGQIAGLVVFAAGFLAILWCLLVNPYFSSAVRMQADRGQILVTAGPYGIVRHPAYTGGILFFVASGIALGSWLSVVPMLAGVALVLRRTLLEDAMLRRELAGYADYAQRVRYRLVPGVW